MNKNLKSAEGSIRTFSSLAQRGYYLYEGSVKIYEIHFNRFMIIEVDRKFYLSRLELEEYLEGFARLYDEEDN